MGSFSKPALIERFAISLNNLFAWSLFKKVLCNNYFSSDCAIDPKKEDTELEVEADSVSLWPEVSCDIIFPYLWDGEVRAAQCTLGNRITYSLANVRMLFTLNSYSYL